VPVAAVPVVQMVLLVLLQHALTYQHAGPTSLKRDVKPKHVWCFDAAMDGCRRVAFVPSGTGISNTGACHPWMQGCPDRLSLFLMTQLRNVHDFS
jgi:hypothetical protein